jgi:nucleoside-diphosphate kinase
MNLVHASDSADSARREIEIYFRPGEILAYPPTITPWLRAPDES